MYMYVLIEGSRTHAPITFVFSSLERLQATTAFVTIDTIYKGACITSVGQAH